jgi:hypothetical protein
MTRIEQLREEFRIVFNQFGQNAKPRDIKGNILSVPFYDPEEELSNKDFMVMYGRPSIQALVNMMGELGFDSYYKLGVGVRFDGIASQKSVVILQVLV